jgi:hypothetical protein
MRKSRKINPWLHIFSLAKNRCLNKNNPRYKDYGGRGISFKLTLEDIKNLWFRDVTPNMKRPSIDRIDNNGNYELSNCRFIEMSDNSKNTRRIRSVIRIGNEIKYYRSIREAARDSNCSSMNIWSCLNNRRKTCGGFRWKYSN